LYLADHIRIAEIGPQMVLLDLRRSRYHAVPPPVRDVLRQVMRGQALGPGPSRIGALLVDHGLLNQREAPARYDRQTPPLRDDGGTVDAVAEGGCSIPWVARLLVLQIVSAWALRVQSLETLVARLACMRANNAGHCASDAEAARDKILRAFRATHRVVPPRNRCFMKSIALFKALTAAGIGVDLVVGVRAAPFFAHCWVQHQGRLLDDTVERVRLFTPILVV
jgi:hypothetical protein